MRPGPLALALALLAAPAAAVADPPTEAVDYPLGPLPYPDLAAPGEPFKLVDLSYDASDTDHTTQAFGARLKVEDWGYFAASFEGERREATWTTQRLDLSLAGESGVYDLSGRYRARWFILEAAARNRSASESGGWLVRPSLSVRLSPDFELLGSASGDTGRPYGRLLQAASLGFLWQRGVGFEAAGGYTRSHAGTSAGFENTEDLWDLTVLGQVGRAELTGEASWLDVAGRFPRRDVEATAGARVQLASRLLAEGGAHLRFEQGASLQAHEYRGALTWFGRRYYLPRTGEAARRELALAREATRMGYNERRVYAQEELRTQRERLSLSRRRDELGGDVDGLYRAQVAERPVPLLGVEWLDAADAIPGVATTTAAVFVGMPWPPAWPWQANEAAVPFLRLDLRRERQTSGPDFAAITYAVSLSAALNRYMDLVLSWRRSDPTALDVIQGIGQRRTIELAYVYAFGR